MNAIRRTLKVLLAGLLLAAVPAVPGHAGTAASGDPFAGLDSVDVTLEIGGPLDLRGSEEVDLFAGDLRRRNYFSLGLTEAVERKIATCGLFRSPEVSDVIAIRVSGRLEEQPQGPPLNIYLVEVSVLKSTLGKPPEPTRLRSVIGVVEDAGLEAALTEAALAILSGELRNCSG